MSAGLRAWLVGPPLAAALALGLAGCAPEKCAAACEAQKGTWKPEGACMVPELAALRFQIDVGTTNGSCLLIVRQCQGTSAKTSYASRACDTQLAQVRLGDAYCAVKVDEMGTAPTAVCRYGDKACEFAFVKDTSPFLACTGAAVDAGAGN